MKKNSLRHLEFAAILNRRRPRYPIIIIKYRRIIQRSLLLHKKIGTTISGDKRMGKEGKKRAPFYKKFRG